MSSYNFQDMSDEEREKEIERLDGVIARLHDASNKLYDKLFDALNKMSSYGKEKSVKKKYRKGKRHE